MNQPPRPQYSVTSLMTYEACPLQYYYIFVRRIPPPRSRAMETGVSIHKLIADHFRRPALLPPEVSPELQGLLDTFKRSRFNVPCILTEKAFALSFERGDVQGRIDLVLPRQDGGLEVVDFKSGTARSPGELDRSLQLPLYALAVSRLFERRVEDVSYTYYFLRDGAEVSFRPTPNTMEKLNTRVESILDAIQAERFEAGPGCRCHACRRERRTRSATRGARVSR